MTNNFITEISWEDFKKIDPVIYTHEKITDAQGSSYKFLKQSAVNYIQKNVCDYYANKLEDKKLDNVLIALHTEPAQEAVASEESYEKALYDYSYLDKYMNVFTGMQTFQIADNIEHVYSSRDYWELREDYWKVRKTETKAIYLIHF